MIIGFLRSTDEVYYQNFYGDNPEEDGYIWEDTRTDPPTRVGYLTVAWARAMVEIARRRAAPRRRKAGRRHEVRADWTIAAAILEVIQYLLASENPQVVAKKLLGAIRATKRPAHARRCGRPGPLARTSRGTFCKVSS